MLRKTANDGSCVLVAAGVSMLQAGSELVSLDFFRQPGTEDVAVCLPSSPSKRSQYAVMVEQIRLPVLMWKCEQRQDGESLLLFGKYQNTGVNITIGSMRAQLERRHTTPLNMDINRAHPAPAALLEQRCMQG